MAVEKGQLALVDDRKIILGDDWTLKLNFRDKVTGQPVPVDGYAYECVLERQEDDSMAAIIGVDSSQGSSGVLTLSIDNAITATLSKSTRYEWHLRATQGGRTVTWLRGAAEVDDA